MCIVCPDDEGPEALQIIHSRDAGQLGRCYELGPSVGVVTVGRHADSTIVLESDSASRRHARFERRDDGWWVVDGGSTNGTFVNGEKAAEARLRSGDRVQIGDTIFRLAPGRPREIVETHYTRSPRDGLTGLFNRRHLLEQIERELRHPERPWRPLSLVLLDLDRFKRVNDTFGHLAGDQVLREVAALVQRNARPGQVAARYGGEELALLLPGGNIDEAAALAGRLRAEVEGHVVRFEGQAISLTVSAGVAQVTESTRSASDLVAAADAKLYEAKRGGRNQVVW